MQLLPVKSDKIKKTVFVACGLLGEREVITCHTDCDSDLFCVSSEGPTRLDVFFDKARGIKNLFLLTGVYVLTLRQAF